MLLQKQKNQGVQCSIKDSILGVKNVDEKLKQHTTTKFNKLDKEDNLESCSKHNAQSKFKLVFFIYF